MDDSPVVIHGRRGILQMKQNGRYQRRRSLQALTSPELMAWAARGKLQPCCEGCRRAIVDALSNRAAVGNHSNRSGSDDLARKHQTGQRGNSLGATLSLAMPVGRQKFSAKTGIAALLGFNLDQVISEQRQYDDLTRMR